MEHDTNMDVLSFHQIIDRDTGVGIFARLHTLTASISAHRHDFWELAFAVKGHGHYQDEQVQLPLLSGDVWLVRPGQWHAYPLVKEELSIFNLLFTGEFMETYATTLRGIRFLALKEDTRVSNAQVWPIQHLRLSPQGLDHVCKLLVALSDELHTVDSPGHAALCTGLALQILALLDRYSIDDISLTSARQDPGLLAALCLIEEHYAESLTLEDIAYQSGYTASYLARKFRHRFGVPPIDYLIQVRLQHACTLLQTTDWSVMMITQHVGFADSRYFATRFRRALGMTPSQFREQKLEPNHTHRG